MAVADDDAFIYQIVVDLRGVSHLCKEEVGIRGIHLLADGKHRDFTLLKIWMISLEAKAIPKRMAAHPQAFDIVLSTIRLGYFDSSERSVFWEEKSLYASSTITRPSKPSITLMTSSRFRQFPVGLFGVQIQMIFVWASVAASNY